MKSHLLTFVNKWETVITHVITKTTSLLFYRIEHGRVQLHVAFSINPNSPKSVPFGNIKVSVIFGLLTNLLECSLNYVLF
jgi:hypothetical protein